MKMPKQECKFSEDLKKKIKCFIIGKDDFKAECLVCNSGTVYVANKGTVDLTAYIYNSEKH